MRQFFVKLILFVPFLYGCNYSTSFSSEAVNWCFYDFSNRSRLDNYVAIYEKSSKGANNATSMKLLGCVYYQKGALLEAEQWLTTAYQEGGEGAASALTAMYLKEGDLKKASLWNKEISTETNQVRWMKVVIELKRYKETGRDIYLIRARMALEDKMNFEGSTDMMVNLLSVIDGLIDPVCGDDAECSVVDIEEKKYYLDTLSEGILVKLVPSVPLAWKYEPDQVGVVPEGLEPSQDSAQAKASEEPPAPAPSSEDESSA